MSNTNLKTVALVGRPNVGKSTLFNRLIGRREAIETDIPGTTRDRLYGEIFWCSEHFSLIDVAGLETGRLNEISQSAQESVELAISGADLIVFLVDWNDKSNDLDKIIARKLRQTNKPIILAVNKADNLERQGQIEEFKRLGSFDLIAVSAISGKSTGDLLDLICNKLKTIPNKEKKIPKEVEGKINLAVIGRPNVGKSTLLNTIIGEKRALVSPQPGTTRDSFSVSFMHKNHLIEIADTAGIRRPGKIKHDSIESFSVLRSLRALKNADIAVLVIDTIEGLVAGDAHLLGQAIEWGKGAVLAVNKIDLWEQDEKAAMGEQINYLQTKLNFAPWLPTVFISAQDDKNIKPLLNQVVAAAENRQMMIPEEDLNQILEFAKERNMQLAGVTLLKQKKAAPPTFEIKIKGRRPLHATQLRYLENKIRDNYPLTGTPIFIDAKSPSAKR